MKKTKLTRSLLAACSIVALSAVMYGCIGGGDDPATDETDMEQPTEPTEPTEPMQTPAEQLEAAEAALETAQEAVAELTPTSTGEEARAAYEALADAQTAVNAATALPANKIAALNERLGELGDDLDDANDLAAELRAVAAAVSAASTAVAGLDNDSDAADVSTARTTVTAAQTALDGAMLLSEDDTAAQQGLIDSADSRLGSIETAVAARPTEAEIAAAAAAAKAAGTKVEAIDTEAGQTDEAGLGGHADSADADTAYTVTIKHDGTDATAEIGDPLLADDDDPKFIDQDAGLDGGRTMLVRTMEADEDDNVVQEVVIVATDIDAPKATPFAKVAGQALNARDLDDEVNADNMGAADDDWTAKTVGDSATDTPGVDELKLVMSGAFVPGPGTSTRLTFARYQEDSDDAMDGEQTIAAFETPGTYNGAMGTYRCNATGNDDCTATVNAKGEITAMSAGWVFTPAAGATSDVPDDEYLSYGFWLQKTTDGDGVLTYDEVETFATAHGMEASPTSGIETVTGSASYEGGAVGVYVKNVLDDQANIVSATSGHFKAAVELEASFGGGNIGINNQFAIGGTITDFDLQHGEDNDWAVSLDAADFSGRADGVDPGEGPAGNAFANVFSGTATGDSTAAEGSWNGVFHGAAGQIDHDDDGGTTPAINTAPSAVTGEFNANFTDGSTAGAFGANKE